MNPANFAEANKTVGAPAGWSEAQCRPIPAFIGQVRRGSLDGEIVVVVAWQPSPEEIEEIKNGQPIFLTMVGGLAPHFISTSFQQAINVA